VRIAANCCAIGLNCAEATNAPVSRRLSALAATGFTFADACELPCDVCVGAPCADCFVLLVAWSGTCELVLCPAVVWVEAVWEAVVCVFEVPCELAVCPAVAWLVWLDTLCELLLFCSVELP